MQTRTLEIGSEPGYAASAVCRISGILDLLRPSLPFLNCLFLIFSANSNSFQTMIVSPERI
jgi:hypothetical protein